MVHSVTSHLALIMFIGTSLFAFVKGGAGERGAAAVIGLSWIGGFIAVLLVHNVWSKQVLELTLFGIDGALAVGLLVLALRFAKIWLGFAMLIQSVELALHGAAMGDWGFPFREYIFLNNLVSFALLLMLAVATGTAWMQRTRKGSAPASSDTLGSADAFTA